jgi:trimethylamine:corrinoid methyltransferase-like protein
MPYPGVGSLDNGGVGSATQAVLDIEIKKSEFMRGAIAVDDTAIPWPEIVGRVEAQKDFMTSDHTLDHFRELWGSPLFRTDDPAVGGWAGDEKAILDKCDEMWRESLKTYTPPQWPDDTLKALDHVVADAHKELLEA